MKKVWVILVLSFFLMQCSHSLPDSDTSGRESAGKDKKPVPSVKPTDAKSSSSKRSNIPQQPGLKAGFADDNKQFNHFLNFLKEYNQKAKHYSISINERIQLKFSDQAGKSVPNASVSVYAEDDLLSQGKTYADGSFFFFPSQFKSNAQSYTVEYSYLQTNGRQAVNRSGKRVMEINVDANRYIRQNVPLDILFILDTTGSMGEEIDRLLATIDIIHLNLTSLNTKPDVRFGMVLYRDRQDDYTTRIVPLTNDVDKFRKQLQSVTADGGGDTPEDLQAALKETMTSIKWCSDGIRLAYIITDAAPHLDYNQKYTYTDAIRDAKKQGVKIFSIGTGGLDIMGEYVLRQISQYTYGKYIFLTYGEKGESEGGKPGSVSHHTGFNYQMDKLESIIIRFTKEELSHLTDQPIEPDEDYLQAIRIDEEEKEQTLHKLFSTSLSQLIGYSTLKLTRQTVLAVLPISSHDYSIVTDSEYFTEQLGLSLSKNRLFKLTERRDLRYLLEEMGLSQAGVTDASKASEIGKILSAEVVLFGHIYSRTANYELFLKLVCVETAEVLSVTKLIIDRQLGLNS